DFRPRGPVGEIDRGRDRAAQAVALLLAVGPIAGRPELADLLAVGLEQRHVHPVVGGPAPQGDGSQARHQAPPPGHRRVSSPPPRWLSVSTPASAVYPRRRKRGDKKTRRRAMSAYKSVFLQVLAERGFPHQISAAEGLDPKAKPGPITAYVGFDATAPSLHIG